MTKLAMILAGATASMSVAAYFLLKANLKKRTQIKALEDKIEKTEKINAEFRKTEKQAEESKESLETGDAVAVIEQSLNLLREWRTKD